MAKQPSRSDPYKAFNFIVEIDGVQSAGFTECSGLSTETAIIEYREGSDPDHVRKLPGIHKFSNITLKRGMTSNRELWQWRNNIIQGQIDRRNGAIIIMSDDRKEVARITFVSGWPSKWEGPHLNAQSSEVAIETLEIAHEGLELA
jgi:phage tail-like protein